MDGSARSQSVSAQAKPNAVFKTTPAADREDVVRGLAPLTVQFNNCQSRPAEEGDDLKFTYDFDNDGVVDEFGHCRSQRTYTTAVTARVCVSDRRPGNEVCQEWIISPGGVESRTVTSLSFTMDNYNCGGTDTFQFHVNGVLAGTFSSSAPCSCFQAGHVETVTFNSSAALAAWNNGGSNTIRFVKPSAIWASPAVAYVKMQVTRSDGSQLSSCVYDADGVSACTGVTACQVPDYQINPVDVSVVVAD